MFKKDKIDRAIVLIYRSRNAHGETNFARPISWIDGLSMCGLQELERMFASMQREVLSEMEFRKSNGMPKFPRKWYEDQEAERAGGAALLAQIGVADGEALK